jgi:hypothetical protein
MDRLKIKINFKKIDVLLLLSIALLIIFGHFRLELMLKNALQLILIAKFPRSKEKLTP